MFGIKCEDCGRYLERTPSAFLACLLGHGWLVQESGDPQRDYRARWGSWFDDDPLTAA